MNEQTANTNQLNFDLTFVANATNPDIGVIQVNAIQAKNLSFGKSNVDIICKG